MASSNIKKKLALNEQFRKEVRELYSNSNYELYAERFENLFNIHSAKYGTKCCFISSPGRIEVCGNHTDHNNGKVLCASISVDTLGAVTVNNENIIRVDSIGYPPLIIDIKDLAIKKEEYGTSQALVKGVLKYFIDHNYKVGGFNATTTSDVFKGAGVSSSASFEVFVSECLNIFYNDSKIDAVTKALASQYAENIYFGKPCGLMDQSAIALGGVSYIDFKDTKNPVIKSIRWGLEKDFSIVLVNTGGDHADLTEHYAMIRRDMEAIASHYGVKTLRFVDEVKFYQELNILQKTFSGRAILRAMHFFNENKRVIDASLAIENNDISLFVNNINNSGDSSYKLLQNCYAPNDLDQRVALGLALAENIHGLKAARVHGGGFAGTILCFVEPKFKDEFIEKMSKVFKKESVFDIGIRNSGTRLVDVEI